MTGIIAGKVVGELTDQLIMGIFAGAIIGMVAGGFAGGAIGTLVGTFAGGIVGEFTGGLAGGIVDEFNMRWLIAFLSISLLSYLISITIRYLRKRNSGELPEKA